MQVKNPVRNLMFYNSYIRDFISRHNKMTTLFRILENRML